MGQPSTQLCEPKKAIGSDEIRTQLNSFLCLFSVKGEFQNLKSLTLVYTAETSY